jgi:hypothetical protein
LRKTPPSGGSLPSPESKEEGRQRVIDAIKVDSGWLQRAIDWMKTHGGLAGLDDGQLQRGISRAGRAWSDCLSKGGDCKAEEALLTDLQKEQKRRDDRDNKVFCRSIYDECLQTPGFEGGGPGVELTCRQREQQCLKDPSYFQAQRAQNEALEIAIAAGRPRKPTPAEAKAMESARIEREEADRLIRQKSGITNTEWTAIQDQKRRCNRALNKLGQDRTTYYKCMANLRNKLVQCAQETDSRQRGGDYPEITENYCKEELDKLIKSLAG